MEVIGVELTHSLFVGFLYWYVRMHYPRYDRPIKNLSRSLTFAILGVRRQAWGYPTPNPDNGVEIYYSDLKYEAQVSLSTNSRT